MRPFVKPVLVFALGMFWMLAAGLGWTTGSLTPDALLVAGAVLTAASFLMEREP